MVLTTGTHKFNLELQVFFKLMQCPVVTWLPFTAFLTGFPQSQCRSWQRKSQVILLNPAGPHVFMLHHPLPGFPVLAYGLGKAFQASPQLMHNPYQPSPTQYLVFLTGDSCLTLICLGVTRPTGTAKIVFTNWGSYVIPHFTTVLLSNSNIRSNCCHSSKTTCIVILKHERNCMAQSLPGWTLW